MSGERWARSPKARSWSGRSDSDRDGFAGRRDRDTQLQPTVTPLLEASHERSSGSSRSSSVPLRHSQLHNTASLEPSSSGSSGILVYHANSVQYESSSASQSPSVVASINDHPHRPTTRSRSASSSWKRLGQSCRSRIPRRSGSLLVFVLNVIESFAFYGALESTLRVVFSGSDWHETALALLVKFTAGRLFYPIAGFLGDVYFGRYKMIQIGIWLFWIAFILLSMSLSIAAGIVDCATTLTTLAFPIIAFVLISAGSGAIEVTIIPFGVDQLSQGASSHEQSSYFYWFYFGRQLGSMMGILSFYSLSLLRIEQDHSRNNLAIASIQSVVALAAMTLALILMWWFKRSLFKDRQRENPLKEVVNVIYYAATVKDSPPANRRAFRYGEGKKRRIDRAKFRYDGLYTSEEVEDVKTFCKILLVLFSLGLCFMTYNGVYSMLEYKVATVYKVNLDLFLLFPDLFVLWNIVTVMVALLILNFIVLPCIPSSTMRERIGFGVALVALSAVLSAYLEWCVLSDVSSQHKFLWLILPSVCVSLGEVLLFVTSLEFIYAQSPEQMKGLLTGLFYLVFGLFSGAATLFFLFYPKLNHTHNFAWYFVIYSVVGWIGFLMYVVVACLYSNRDRPEEEDFN